MATREEKEKLINGLMEMASGQFELAKDIRKADKHYRDNPKYWVSMMLGKEFHYQGLAFKEKLRNEDLTQEINVLRLALGQ